MSSEQNSVVDNKTVPLLNDYITSSESFLKPLHPSSNRAQDISHILADIFKDDYTRGCFDKETTENLISSSNGSNKHHKKYIDQLEKIQKDHKELLESFDLVEKHIIEVRAKTYSADVESFQEELQSLEPEKFIQLGLPTNYVSFQQCIDEDLLAKHQLIIPSKVFATDRPHKEAQPRKTDSPKFQQSTQSSRMRFSKSCLDDGFLPDPYNLKKAENTSLALKNEIGDSPDLKQSKQLVDSTTLFKKNKWRQNMNHKDRIEDKKALSKLAKKHEFLKNPRFLPLTNPKGAKLLVESQKTKTLELSDRKIVEKIANSEVQYFKSKPQVLTFNQWTVGEVLECVLELRNESAVSRHLRVLPPKTSYFSLGLGKFPGNQGTVAPGMSAQFYIRFIPDALCDFVDYVDVISQSSSPLRVFICAKRPPPVLTLSDTLKCNNCLVKGVQITRIPIKNLGGDGRFCIMKKSSWPAPNLKTSVNPSVLDLGIFQIRPALFQILSGESMTLDLIFAPQSEGTFEEEILFICDNCQTKELKISGCSQKPSVKLASVSDGGTSEAELGEVIDLTANHLVRFHSLNCHSFFIKQLIVHNITNVSIPFTWHILKPNLSTDPFNINKDTTCKSFDFYPDENSPFTIEPIAGILLPDSNHEFYLTFSPSKVGSFDNVLHLLLSDIPCDDEDDKSVKAVLTIQNQPETPTSAPFNQVVERTSQIEYHEIIGLEIEVKANCVPYSIIFNPPLISIPGQILQGFTARRPLQIANYSMAPVCYRWVSETLPHIIEVDPPVGRVNPGEVVEHEVKVTGSFAGKLQCKVECLVEQLEDPLVLLVEADIAGPHAVLDISKLDFGLVKKGDRLLKVVTVRNTTQVPAKWKLLLPDIKDCDELTISPQSGHLRSLESCKVEFIFHPKEIQSLETLLNLEVESGNSFCVQILAQVQSPKACFVESLVQFEDTYLNTPNTSSATLLNLTSFATQFQFSCAIGEQASNCEVVVKPASGLLMPKDRINIEVEILCDVVGDLNKVYIPCSLEGMEEPIVLSLSAFIKDLKVEFSTADCKNTRMNQSEELKLKFDDPLDIGSTRSFKLTIKNLTAIETMWSLCLDNFSLSTIKKVKKLKIENEYEENRRIRLKKTLNLADPSSKTPEMQFAEKSGKLLKNGDGIAFEVSEANGVLKSFETKHILISVFCNMWGTYLDMLTCNIEGLKPTRIPVEVQVCGSPLRFKLAAEKSLNPTLRFGTHFNHAPAVFRNLKIFNISSFDIRIDWRTFNYAPSSVQKIIDFNIWFGEEFPALYANGKPPFEKKCSHHSNVSLRPVPPPPKSTYHQFQEFFDSDDSKSCIYEDPFLLSPDQSSIESTIMIPQDVVHVKLKPHEGSMSDSPFEIQPKQIIVPAFGEGLLQVSLKPSEIELSEKLKLVCKSFSLGYMSLEPPDKESVNKFNRKDGSSIVPLRLEMTSVIKKGQIQIDEDDDDFFLLLGDILNDEKTTSKTQIRIYNLRNNSSASITFILKVSNPFFIEDKTSKQSIQIELPAQTNYKIKIGFKICLGTINQLISLRHKEKLNDVKLQRISPGFENLNYESSLEIEFIDGSIQKKGLKAQVSIPSFSISQKFVDFGKCFIGQKNCKKILIKNLGPSECYWSLDSFIKSSEQESGEFYCVPSKGKLLSLSSRLDLSTETISIYFTAKTTELTDTRFIINGKFAEQNHLLRVQGQGSFDGVHEFK